MKLNICACLHAKFQVSTIILTSFRHGICFYPCPHPTLKRTPKSPPRFGFKKGTSSTLPNIKKTLHHLINKYYCYCEYLASDSIIIVIAITIITIIDITIFITTTNLTIQSLVSTKRSHILKQTCS